MNAIPAKFSKNGWNYKLLERSDRVAIYSQSRHPDLPANGKATAYEVVLVRVAPPKTINDPIRGARTLGVREFLPSTEEFGRFGWTVATLSRAREKMAEIEAGLLQRRAPKGAKAS